MQNEIGAYDAKTKLPEILRRVEAGESFVVTNRGRPVAEIVPYTSNQRKERLTAINMIMETKKQYVSDEFLQESKEYGRK